MAAIYRNNRRRPNIGLIVGVIIGVMVLIFLLSLCIAMRRIRARRALISNLSGAPPPRPMFMPWGAKNAGQHNNAPMTQPGAGIGHSGGTADVPPPAYGKESISQNDTFAPPPGPPPQAYTGQRHNNAFVGGFKQDNAV